MTAFHYAVPASCLALLLSSTGAFAQVTAQQVWDDWKANLGMYGTEGVTIGSENYANGVLTVTDLGFAMTEEEMSVSGNLPQLVLTEQPDGTVAVTMAETYPISISATDEFGSVTNVAMSLNQTGATMTVSGTPDSLTYDLSITRYEVVVDEINVDGEIAPVDAVIGANNMTGSYVTSGPAEMRDIAYDIAVESVDIKASGAEPGTQNSFSVNGAIAAIAAQAAMTLPANLAEIEPEAIFASGFAMDGSQTFGATDLSFTVNENGNTTQGSLTLTGGDVNVVLAQSAIDYGFSFLGLAMETSGAELPFPVAFAADEIALGIAMPMAPTEAPADFSAGVTLAGVTINEELWAMVDPGAVLPRDPATVNLDLTGTATLLMDLMAQDEGGMAMMGPPGLLNSLDINDITVAFGGADVHAEGAFTFDNNDMNTFPGMPRPIGQLDIALNGVNGLVQKLVQLGVVPAEQVMGVSMMLGMFTVPVGDDQLTSTIEFTPDGQLLANGQRLQ